MGMWMAGNAVQGIVIVVYSALGWGVRGRRGGVIGEGEGGRPPTQSEKFFSLKARRTRHMCEYRTPKSQMTHHESQMTHPRAQRTMTIKP